ncbi:hypothetical protein IAT38_006793 [Cryptococcus sp. DSM 104549]
MSTKYPARAHAAKVVEQLLKVIPEEERGKLHGIFLQGSPTLYRDDTDHEHPFHQEANFNYLSGAIHPNCSLAIFFTPSASPPSIKHHLFIPAADPGETMWSVPPPTLEAAEAAFDTDHIAFTSALPSVLQASATSSSGGVTLHLLPRTTLYPPLPDAVQQAQGVVVEDKWLLQAVQVARLVKDETEISLIREANRIASGAHEVVMRELGRFAQDRVAGGKGGKEGRTGKEGIRQWEMEGEQDVEAVFVASCTRMGAQHQAYLPIVASGTRASTLHYVCNDRLFPSTAVPRSPTDKSFKPPALTRGCCGTLAAPHSHSTSPTELHDEAFYPQVLLIDAGCEWEGYASDITRVVPVGNGGKFTKEAGEIYELVLKMQKECEALVTPGVHWDTLHLHAHKVLISGLLSLGILVGSPADILASGISAAFLPHGLGHSLGLDTHDSLQYLRSTHLSLPPSTAKTPEALYRYLRIRLPLEEGMVLTVEPGCYFAPQLMEEHGVWESKFVDQEKLREYTAVGGVRIEDVVVVRKEGVENLTTVGKEREWVEGVASGRL